MIQRREYPDESSNDSHSGQRTYDDRRPPERRYQEGSGRPPDGGNNHDRGYSRRGRPPDKSRGSPNNGGPPDGGGPPDYGGPPGNGQCPRHPGRQGPSSPPGPPGPVRPVSALTHITQICHDFDIANSCRIHSNAISMVPFTHAAFFVANSRQKLHDKKGSRAKKSHDKKISLCVSRHL